MKADNNFESLPHICLFLFDENWNAGYAELLAKWGYTATGFSSVSALLRALKKSHFDLLLLDLCHSYIELHIDDLLKLPNKILFLACDRRLHGLLLPSEYREFMEKPVDVEAFRLKLRDLLGSA